MASLQCGPVQCFQQAVDMGGVSISAKQVQSGLLIIALLQLCGIADSWKNNGMIDYSVDYHEETMVWLIIMNKYNGVMDKIMVWLIIMKLNKYSGVADYHEETMVWLIIMKYYNGVADCHEEAMPMVIGMIIMNKYSGVADYYEETMVWLIIMNKYGGVADYYEETMVWLIIKNKYNGVAD